MKTKYKNITVNVDEGFYKKVKIKAVKDGIKITNVIRDFLNKWVLGHGDEPCND